MRNKGLSEGNKKETGNNIVIEGMIVHAQKKGAGFSFDLEEYIRKGK